MPAHLGVMHSILLVVFMLLVDFFIFILIASIKLLAKLLSVRREILFILLSISLQLLAERIKVLVINVRACGILRLW